MEPPTRTQARTEPLSTLGSHQGEFADEAGERRDARDVHGRDEEEQGEQGRAAGHAAEPGQLRGAAPAFDQPGDEEERGLHGDVVDDIDDGSGDALAVGEADAEDHVADVADQGEGEQPLQVGLGDGAEDADDHRGQRDDQEQVAQPVAGEEQGLRAEHAVDADLGEQAGEDGGDGGGRRRIGVGQPGGDREDGGLDAEDGQQHRLDEGGDAEGEVVEPLGELREVDGAGGRVGDGDGHQEDHRGEQRDDHIGRTGPYPGAGAAEGEQDEAGDQHDLEADEEVHEVAA